MLFRGIRTKIALNLAALIFITAFLTNFILINLIQRDLIQRRISAGLTALEFVSASFFPAIDRRHSQALIDALGIGAACLISPDGKKQVFGHSPQMPDARLAALALQAGQTGQRQTRFEGNTWGIFWRQKHHVIVASPVDFPDRGQGAACLVLPLKGVYRQMQALQGILWIYIILNTLLLTGIGLYRMVRIQVHPVQRLVRIAEAYREEDDIQFSVRKGDNELNRLSAALNAMMKKIAENRKTLSRTVECLEKANAELAAAQKDVVRAEKLASIGRLSSGIAHEIGNPIGIVIGYLELLKGDDLDAGERAEYIHRTEAEINRINQIIRQLLDFSRASKGESVEVGLHDVLREIKTVLKMQPLMRNITIETCLTAENDHIRSDPQRLRQVFLNLAINAADAIGQRKPSAGGKLTIASSLVQTGLGPSGASTDAIKIIFEDNGPGIAADQIDAIFDPFYTTKEPGKGTGLGLYVSFMIIDALGGKIEAASRPGRGATLTIYMPLMASQS